MSILPAQERSPAPALACCVRPLPCVPPGPRPWLRQRQPEDRGLSAGLDQPDWKVLTSRSILAAWRKKPELPKPISWNVYKIASKAVRLGKVAAPGGKGGGGIQGAGREADGDTAVTRKGEITRADQRANGRITWRLRP